MKKFEDLLFSISDGIAHISMNRPHRLNAYRNQTADELRCALAAAEADASARVVLLTGEGRAFGSGYDLSSVDTGQPPDLDVIIENHFNPLIRKMRQSQLPIVTAINGPCAGAAVGVALAGDIVIAGRSAYLLEPFGAIALAPDAGNSLFVPRIVGRVRAAGMMMLGDRVPAEKALQWGLLWDVVDDDQLRSSAEAICRRLITFDAGALACTKHLIEQAAEFGGNEQLDLERDIQGDLGRQPALRQKIADFFAKRPS